MYTYMPQYEDSKFLKKENKKTYTFRRNCRQKEQEYLTFDKEFQQKAL